MTRILALALLCILSTCGMQPVFAVDNGQYGDVPDDLRSWFKSVRSPNGVPCCDIADGYRIPADLREPADENGSFYWVLIAGQWRNVPKGAVVHSAGNPLGEAITWYVAQGADNYYIRCFVPPGGV
jgi:hypothetical protein